MYEPLAIIAQGDRWVAVNKPAGIAVEQHFQHDTVERRALQQFKREGATKQAFVGIVHRLDRPVSGVLLLALNQSTLVSLNELFANNQIQKTYWAIVHQPPPQAEGHLKHFLLRDKFNRKAIAAQRPLPGALEAQLSYKVLQQKDGRYLLEVKPISGRFHQIRVQLAAMGCPIIGDATYGSIFPYHEQSIALHASSLSFTPPGQTAAVWIQAEPPPYFSALLQ